MSVPMNRCGKCGATWTGGLPEHEGICPHCGYDNKAAETRAAKRAASTAQVVKLMDELGVMFWDIGGYTILRHIADDGLTVPLDEAFVALCRAHYDFTPGDDEYLYARQLDEVRDKAEELGLLQADDEEED